METHRQSYLCPGPVPTKGEILEGGRVSYWPPTRLVRAVNGFKLVPSFYQKGFLNTDIVMLFKPAIAQVLQIIHDKDQQFNRIQPHPLFFVIPVVIKHRVGQSRKKKLQFGYSLF